MSEARTAEGTTPELSVVDAPESQRYEARDADGTLLGFAVYQKTDQLVVFTHTEVDDAQEGKGVGSALVRAALDDVRRQHKQVLPLCPFVKAWIGRHREYVDLVYGAPQSKVTD